MSPDVDADGHRTTGPGHRPEQRAHSNPAFFPVPRPKSAISPLRGVIEEPEPLGQAHPNE
jgi:hypothetical protein